jgi:hypothetical protein
MRLLTVDEFHHELERRHCKLVKLAYEGYEIWITENDKVFSVPPPEEPGEDLGLRYPDYILDDLIEELSLPEPAPTCH